MLQIFGWPKSANWRHQLSAHRWSTSLGFLLVEFHVAERRLGFVLTKMDVQPSQCKAQDLIWDTTFPMPWRREEGMPFKGLSNRKPHLTIKPNCADPTWPHSFTQWPLSHHHQATSQQKLWLLSSRPLRVQLSLLYSNVFALKPWFQLNAIDWSLLRVEGFNW